MSLAQRIVLKALVSTVVEHGVDKLAMTVTVRRRFMEYMFFSLFPFPEYLPTRINFKYGRAMKGLDSFVYAAIKKRRAAKHPPYDLLSMLMNARYKGGAFMNDRQVHDEALTISITGHETIGEALTWTWYLLSQHPKVASKLVSEFRGVLNGRNPTVVDLPKLRYAEMVLEESMRLYPPTWIFIRMARRDDALPSGAAIPSGAKLYLSPYVMHRNRKYFSEPERFDPERFNDEAKAGRHRLVYFPFGNGPRVCIGEAFARMEGVLVLASIAQRFKLTVVPGQTIVPEPKMTLRPKNGILMRLDGREPSW